MSIYRWSEDMILVVLPEDLEKDDPLIAYRTRAILTDVRFASEKSHEFVPGGANRRSHRK